MSKRGPKPSVAKEVADVREIVDMVARYQAPEDFMFDVLKSLPNEPATSLPSEWAEKVRYLPKTSGTPFPGRFNFNKSPWWKEPLDHFSPHSTIRQVAIMKANQIGFTCAVLENAIGFTIGAQPGPFLFVSGDENLIKTAKKMRIDPMLDNSGLRSKIRPENMEKRGIKRTGDSGNLMEFPGGYGRLCGPNVEANFQGISFKYLLLDEVDLFPYSLGTSGETVRLIRRRSDGFDRSKKIIYGSRPTVSFGMADAEKDDQDPAAKGLKKSKEEMGSRILDLYNTGDKRKYMVPCPFCGEKQELDFFGGTTHDGVKYGLSFNPKECRDGDFSSVEYLCRGCGKGIKEHYKSRMVQPESGAEWVPTAKAKQPYFVSYQVSSLYSLTFSWESCVTEFLDAKDDPLGLQLFYNGVLGLPFENRTGGVEVGKLTEKTGHYAANTIPKPDAPHNVGGQPLFLTAAVDVQRGKNARLEVEIRGWGRNHRNWGIDYRIIKGNTEDCHDECYKELAAMLDEKWSDKQGNVYQIERMLIDSGDGTVKSTIYDVCRLYGRSHEMLILPLKGQAVTGSTRIYQKVADIPDEHFPLVEVYSDLYKNKVAQWLKADWRQDEAPPLGWPMFPTGSGYGTKYFKQLGNDQRKLERRGNHTIVRWEQHGAIEAWDCLCYGAACEDFVIADYSEYLGLDKPDPEFVWAHFEAQRGLTTPDDED